MTPTPVGVHDAQLRRISTSFSVLSGVFTASNPDLREITVQVRNNSDHTETIGVVIDIIAPTPTIGACFPDGRIAATSVTLAAKGQTGNQTVVKADNGTLGDDRVEFFCTSAAAQNSVVGERYQIRVAVDHNADDIDLLNKALGSCPEFGIQLGTCFSALADDELPTGDPNDNRDLRSAPRIKKSQLD